MERLQAILSNDIARVATRDHLLLSDRQAIAAYLYERGWRRAELPDDVNHRAGNDEAAPLTREG